MFKVGDEVRIKSNGAFGVVDYVEPGYCSVVLNNDSEMDFTDMSKLELAVEYYAEQEKKIAAQKPATPTKTLTEMSYVPMKGDRRLAGKVIDAVKEIAPDLINVMETNVQGFKEMDNFDKVKTLSEVTSTPMVVFMGAGDMGDDNRMMKSVIQKTLLLHMNAGTNLVGEMLLARCQQVIADYSSKE